MSAKGTVLKRVRQSRKANSKNRHYKSMMRTVIKDVLDITDKSKVDDKLNNAKEVADNRNNAGGITQTKTGRFSLRKGTKPKKSPTNETSWLKTLL